MRFSLFAFLAGPALHARSTHALDNGLALTPPMGFNSYMAPASLHNEKGLGAVADFFVSSGLREKGYEYVNTDEGWELPFRHNQTGQLQWDPVLYPLGLPEFIESKLHKQNLKFGIYGAASGVTCGNDPGNLYHEVTDATTYAAWGVDYVKSDNCASYALDSSVRFAALRDALNSTNRKILLSIEPFAITPDRSLSRDVSNMWRIGCDIQGNFETFTDRADLSDKWAPLAGPGGFNDPDMINVQNPPGLTYGENRIYFGMWAIMKAPLILSADLPNLQPEILNNIIGNEEVIAVNQDPLGIQARKIQLDNGAPVPWLVGLEDCSGVPAGTSGVYFSRKWDSEAGGATAGPDTRVWKTVLIPPPHAGIGDGNPKYQIVNAATGRCLTVAAPLAGSNETNRTVLLPCLTVEGRTNLASLWEFDRGVTTVTSVSSAVTGQALAVSNATLYATSHGQDAFAVSDLAYGQGGLVLLDQPFIQDKCTSRDCQNYDPSQMWYFDRTNGLLRHSLYTSSVNHKPEGPGSGYTLTQKVPTFRHHCLAHVLSTGNVGTEASNTEVWAGPLSGGGFVVALLNRGTTNATISASMQLVLESSRTGTQASSAEGATFKVRDLWLRSDAGNVTDYLNATVPPHDVRLFKLSPVS